MVQTGIGDRELTAAELQEVQGRTALAEARVAVQQAQGWDPSTMELHCKAASDMGECLVADLYMESVQMSPYLGQQQSGRVAMGLCDVDESGRTRQVERTLHRQLEGHH